ncbi:MAG: hypothetical protein NVV73_01520 [Cellvibrionaceae bacterium]|nr:hypothetical protein [Cellvibrionaceae bacterium]
MSTVNQHYPVIIIGGGQAGLCVSYYLRQRNVAHLALEKNTQMHTWSKQRWDSFCLVTPNWQCDLPGHPYEGDDPDGFMVKDQIVEYLRGFAAKVAAPVMEHTSVQRVTRLGKNIFRGDLRRYFFRRSYSRGNRLLSNTGHSGIRRALAGGGSSSARRRI